MLCTLIPALCADEIAAIQAEGFKAFSEGPYENPYPRMSLRALWWKQGYSEADDIDANADWRAAEGNADREACQAEGFAMYLAGGDSCEHPYKPGGQRDSWWREGYRAADHYTFKLEGYPDDQPVEIELP